MSAAESPLEPVSDTKDCTDDVAVSDGVSFGRRTEKSTSTPVPLCKRRLCPAAGRALTRSIVTASAPVLFLTMSTNAVCISLTKSDIEMPTIPRASTFTYCPAGFTGAVHASDSLEHTSPSPQLALAEHARPIEHRLHPATDESPQSISLSSPFLIPSEQVGAAGASGVASGLVWTAGAGDIVGELEGPGD